VNAQLPSDVWIAPYLRLSDRTRVGPWQLIPSEALEVADCTSQHAFDQVHGLLELYRRPHGIHQGFGCFLRRGAAQVGASYRDRHLSSFRRAFLLSALDVNVTPWRGSTDDPNWGWRTRTSDALFLVWHRIDPGGWVSARTGAIISTLHGGLRIGVDEQDGLPPSEIAPPLEQPFPFMARSPDVEHAEAVFELLETRNGRAQRLAAAIDWLDLAWRNTTSTSEGMRIVLLKVGFEALLAVGNSLPAQRAALAGLLGRDACRRRERTPLNRFGQPREPERMTDVEWWFSRFTWLRNAIAHGGRELTPRDWKHGRATHFWLGDHWLRTAIRAEVADASGRPYLREADPFARVAARFVWQHEQQQSPA